VKVDRLCLATEHYKHGRPTLAKLQSEDLDYYGSPMMCEDLRRCHAHRVWQAIGGIAAVALAYYAGASEWRGEAHAGGSPEGP
jgi:hypothetical protein